MDHFLRVNSSFQTNVPLSSDDVHQMTWPALHNLAVGAKFRTSVSGSHISISPIILERERVEKQRAHLFVHHHPVILTREAAAIEKHRTLLHIIFFFEQSLKFQNMCRYLLIQNSEISD